MAEEDLDDDGSFDMSAYGTADYQGSPTAAIPSFANGEAIAKYVVQRLLGKGAFGAVYLCQDPYADRDVAVKVFSTGQGVERSAIAGGRFEARANAKVRHPQIAGLLDHGHLSEKKIDYLVFEFIEGQTLESELKRADRLSLRNTISIMRSICEPLKQIHQAGLTHRDLKPANIILDNERRAHVLDFGIALLEEDQSLLPLHVAGTQPFMAPEQLSGQISQVDGRADIWAMGVIMYQMLTGELPFKTRAAIMAGQFRPPSMRQPNLPLELDEICSKCLNVNQTDRYHSAASLEEALSRIALLDTTPVPVDHSPELPVSPIPPPAAVGPHGGAASARPSTTSNQGASRWKWTIVAVAVVSLAILISLCSLLFGPKEEGGTLEPGKSGSSNTTGEKGEHPIGAATGPGFEKGETLPSPTPGTPGSASIGDREVAQWVHELGGLVSVDLSSGEAWVEYPAGSALPSEDFWIVEIDLSPVRGIDDSHLQYLADKNLPRLATLDLEATNISDDGLRHITKFRKLNDIVLNDTPLTDKCVNHLIQVKTLVSLYLANTEITDVGVEQLANLKLTQLDLENLQGVTDASAELLSHIKGLKSQRGLILEGTSITPAAIQRHGLDEYVD